MRKALILTALVLVLPASAPAKGDGPTTIVAAYGSVWVGMGNGTIRRIDPRTHQEDGSIDVGKAYYSYVFTLAKGFGSVWAATADIAVTRIDPRSGRVRHLRIPATPTLVASGAGSVWLGDLSRDEIFRLDPLREHVVSRTRIHGRLMALAGGRAGAWAVVYGVRRAVTGPRGPRLLVRLDREARVLRLDCDQSLAVGDRALWLLDQCDGRLTRIDARSGRVRSILTRRGTGAPVLGFGSVWVIAGEEVSRIDARTLRTRAVFRARATAGAAGEGKIWLLDQGDGERGHVVAVDPRTNRIVGEPIEIRPT